MLTMEVGAMRKKPISYDYDSDIEFFPFPISDDELKSIFGLEEHGAFKSILAEEWEIHSISFPKGLVSDVFDDLEIDKLNQLASLIISFSSEKQEKFLQIIKEYWYECYTLDSLIELVTKLNENTI